MRAYQMKNVLSTESVSDKYICMLSFFEERAYCVGAYPEFEEHCHGFSNSFHAEEQYTDMLYEGQPIVLFARIAERILRDEKTHNGFLRIREALSLMRAEYWHRRTNGEPARISGLSRDCFEKTFKHILWGKRRIARNCLAIYVILLLTMQGIGIII